MYYGLVHFPNIDLNDINRIRSKYDPTADLIAPHIGVMPPVPDSIGELNLIHHIETVLRDWQPFSIQIRGFTKSWDHWLLLTLCAGNQKVVKLHDQIYAGPLTTYRRTDIEFIPHISLGLFVKSQKEYSFKNPELLEFDAQLYQRALCEAEALRLVFQCTIDKLHLIGLSDDFTNTSSVRVFSL